MNREFILISDPEIKSESIIGFGFRISPQLLSWFRARHISY